MMTLTRSRPTRARGFAAFRRRCRCGRCRGGGRNATADAAANTGAAANDLHVLRDCGRAVRLQQRGNQRVLRLRAGGHGVQPERSDGTNRQTCVDRDMRHAICNAKLNENAGRAAGGRICKGFGISVSLASACAAGDAASGMQACKKEIV